MALELPFDTVLIANRGEIAVRIARTCRAMGLRTVAVYSEADAREPHVRACDTAVLVGAAPARDSYLRIDRIIDAARSSGAQAIHPGYGFLSENAAFADACAAAGLIFVGPPASAIRAMGDKAQAKTAVAAAGVPTVPGYNGEEQADTALRREAKRLGMPLLIKAAAGGGGKGMRIVRSLDELRDSIEGARREAQAAFGDQRIILERYLERPRHIEIQILADSHGNVIHLGERECSIQRRHQKVLEETPSVAVSEELRQRMGQAAIAAARSAGYINAGTVEFMLDADGAFYFLEMNTRLQVEHPITELVAGVDLVREQLRIAGNMPLPFSQGDVAPRGHAIEARVYAEDASNGFLPSVGRIGYFEPPQGPGIRNDAGVDKGSTVGVEYDPMLAKLIAFDRTREACVERLAAALDDYRIGGVVTNLPFLQWLVRDDAFRRGETTTDFIDTHFRPAALGDGADDGRFLLAAAAALGSQTWRHAAQPRAVYLVANDRSAQDSSVSVLVERAAGAAWHCKADIAEGDVELNADALTGTVTVNCVPTRFLAWPAAHGGVAVNLNGAVRAFAPLPPPSTLDAAKAFRHGGHAGAGAIEAPMSGKIVKVSAREGEAVVARAVLIVMEAMKMEHTVLAPYDGTVCAVRVKVGDVVAAGDVLAEIEAET